MRILTTSTALLAVLLVSLFASAEVPVVYKHDQFSDNIQTAAQELSGIPLATQPGFVKGEAYGQIYRPSANAYPVKITAVDVVVAGPPNSADGGSSHADIEIWFLDGDGPSPTKDTPDFSLSTQDVFDPIGGDFGMPLKGNTAVTFEFDWDDGEGHPPLLTEGNFIVAIRFHGQAQDLQAEWGTFQCSQMPTLGMCGCQSVGTIHDQASTPKANVMHIIYPPGNCDGSPNKWVHFEDIGVTGDVILRARALANEGVCYPDCNAHECGDDGCGGSCGQCAGGTVCNGGTCCEQQCEGVECGSDGCGGDCGTCAAGFQCNQGVCEDSGCVPQCDGKECGDNGCEGTCGECQADEACVQGKCEGRGPCQTECDGLQCGDDGCGGVCGVCAEGENCVQGKCEGGAVNPGNISITIISPSYGFDDKDTEIAITGTGFAVGATAKLGGTSLTAVQQVSPTLITATVPAGMSPGFYMALVVNPDGATASLLNAFEIRNAEIEGENAPGGCSTSTTHGLAGTLLLALMLAAALVRRRARS